MTDTTEAPPQGGFTIADHAHAIAQLADQIRRERKGWTPAEAVQAVQVALENDVARQALALQAQPFPTLDPEALARLDEQGEDDPETQHETPIEETY